MLLHLLSFVFILSAKTISIDEPFLKESLMNDSHAADRSRLQAISAKAQEAQILDRFDWELNATGSYYKTSEKPFTTFAPVTSPVKSSQLGVQKAFQSGVKTKLGLFSEQFSNNFVSHGTTSGVEFSMAIDLLKDLFGAQTKKQLEISRLGQEIASLQSSIDINSTFQQIRLIYWRLVATQEALKLSNKLLLSAKEQAHQAQLRLKSSIADKGEVARYQSQVASREASIIGLEYQRETLVQSLKELLPNIAAHEIVLSKTDLEKTVQEVVSCTLKISSQSSVPYNFTDYDEIIEMLDQQYSQQVEVTKKYDDMDLKLESTYRRIGKSFSYSDSFDEAQNDPRNSVAVGLSLTIPLSNEKKTTADIQKIVDQKRYLIQKQQIKSKIEAYHTQVVRSISLLNKVMAAQEENTKKLRQSLDETKKKYAQARISVRELINDQDAFLGSGLDEIDTKYNVIKTLLEYFSVFNKTPCAINI